MKTSLHSHKRNARSGLWAFDLACWLTNYVQYITSFFADVLHNCTRLCQDFSFRSHNEGHLTERWSASWNRKVVLRVFSRVTLIIAWICSIRYQATSWPLNIICRTGAIFFAFIGRKVQDTHPSCLCSTEKKNKSVGVQIKPKKNPWTKM